MQLIAKDLIARLVGKAEMYKLLSYRRHNANDDTKLVGQLVLSSSPEEREILKQLRPQDICGMRYPPQDYKQYTVDEKTKKVTVDPRFRPNRKRSSVVALRGINK